MGTPRKSAGAAVTPMRRRPVRSSPASPSLTGVLYFKGLTKGGLARYDVDREEKALPFVGSLYLRVPTGEQPLEQITVTISV